MIRIAFILYRSWAHNILQEMLSMQDKSGTFAIKLLIVPREYNTVQFENIEGLNIYKVEPPANEQIYKLLRAYKIDIAFFYSWSWIVSERIYQHFLSLALHPSPLPKYRGGSPIQHQILNNEKNSAVTIFRIADGIDSGDIYTSTPISLSGNISDIYSRMTNVGVKVTKKLIEDFNNNVISFKPQLNLKNYPPLSRRKPAESEILIEQLQSMQFRDVYNKIRCLTDPYPNAFIRFGYSTLYITEVKKITHPVKTGIVLNERDIKKITKNSSLYLKIKNSYVHVSKFRIVSK